jgi:hypothetical protein
MPKDALLEKWAELTRRVKEFEVGEFEDTVLQLRALDVTI